MYVYCNTIFSTTVHPIDFTLGRFIAEDPTKCSVSNVKLLWGSASQQKLQAATPEDTTSSSLHFKGARLECLRV